MVCVDDYGNACYQCDYTGRVTSEIEMHGALVPGVKRKVPVSNTPEARSARKASAVAFHAMDANCNTCKHLVRVPHEKNSAGFLYGKCSNASGCPDKSPYASRQAGDVMLFHPDDWMGMPCYESRWEE